MLRCLSINVNNFKNRCIVNIYFKELKYLPKEKTEHLFICLKKITRYCQIKSHDHNTKKIKQNGYQQTQIKLRYGNSSEYTTQPVNSSSTEI